MKSVKVSELKAGLSKYLARVKRGDQVLITERGKPVAKLVPLPSRPPGIEAEDWGRLLELERQGRVTIPEQVGLTPEFWAMPRGDDPGGTVVQQLIDDRRRR